MGGVRGSESEPARPQGPNLESRGRTLDVALVRREVLSPPLSGLGEFSRMAR